MRPFARALGVYERLIGIALALGRSLSALCVALMVGAILVQVFQRYVLNDALPWPEEFARACMIWMTALAAPTAYRYGGFVSIDMIRDALPPTIRRVATLLLLVLAAAVLAQLLSMAVAFSGRGWRAATSSLWAPGWMLGAAQPWAKVPSAWVYLAMPVCFGAMLAVNLELVAREVGRWVAGEHAFPEPPRPVLVREAE